MSLTLERLERAHQLLREIHHIPLATVNGDGSPHNSPLFMVFDDTLCAYWISHPETQHSQNITRSGKVFLTVFDSREGHGGVFIAAEARQLDDVAEAARGLEILQKVRKTLGGRLGNITAYTGDAEQRIYCATPHKAWINQSDRDDQGVIIRDRRFEVSLSELAAGLRRATL